jgi:hypothetical protein
MTQKTAKDAMTPISDIFSLHIESKLDEYAPLFDRLSFLCFLCFCRSWKKMKRF